MRLWVMIFEGDRHDNSYSADRRIANWMSELWQNSPSWQEVDEAVRARSLPIDTTPETPIGEFTELTRWDAQELGLARPDDWGELIGVSLVDAVTHETFRANWTVAEADLTDGDLVILRITRVSHISRMVGPSANPRFLFETLQLAANARRHTGAPRLWGVLLYTDEDVELATYVRAHFDELNVLSGPLLSIFVVERPANWATAKQYWRQHLEPPLLRTFSALRWLNWKPYDRSQCYEIARRLGVEVSRLPCLVLFRGTDPADTLTFPIESVTPAYLRGLFGEIERVVGQRPRAYDLDGALEQSRRVYLPDRTDPDVDALVATAATATDTAAFERVAAARQRIRDELGRTYKGEPAVTENFHFYGQTTFINRPVDTVIKDFQNSHAPSVEQEQLTELLRLVLTSADLSDVDKQQAATEIDGISAEVSGGKGLATVEKKLTALQRIVAKAADIAEPALAISARLTELF